MNTSTNKDDKAADVKVGGAFADGLTLVRIILTPVIMAIIILGWPKNNFAILASFLFLIAALTDIFDDYFGGGEASVNRQFGWVDDIADTVLVNGTLIALLYVIFKNEMLAWPILIPAAVIIIRDLLVALIKGYDMTKTGWPETKYGTAKNGIIMLATCLLLASPWLTTWIDSFRATEETVTNVYGNPSPYIWMLGQVLLWVGAALAAFTGFILLTQKKPLAK